MIELTAGDAVVSIDPEAGGRIAQVNVGGRDLLVDRVPDPLGWGCYAMVPWAGRLGDARMDWAGGIHPFTPTMGPHAIHGTAWDRPWRVLDGASATEVTLAVDLGAGHDEWPALGSVEHHLTLGPDELTATLTVRSDATPFPATFGWHPWFRRAVGDDHAAYSFDAATMYERGADHLPTGRTGPPSVGPWDDAFTGVRAWPTLRWGEFELQMSSDVDHLVVFDETAGAICLEPQSAPPDAFRLGLATDVTELQPAEGWMRWRWSAG